jgi:putative PIN family toxin of toxin-antitoxin system
MKDTIKIVIDTNIFISALMKDSLTRKIIVNSKYLFLFPEYEFQEIYKYKDDILRKSGYSEKEFIEAITSLLNHVRVVGYEEIRSNFDEAYEIMKSIDISDTIFIATALALDAFIWSDDKDFKRQNRVKVLTTKDMIEPD